MKAMLALGLGSLFSLNVWAAQQGQQQVAPLEPSGDAVASASVSDRVVTAENSQKATDDIRVRYPEISRDILTLYTIDRVVMTSNGTLDLYTGETLWLTLEKQGQVFAVRNSLYTFVPTSIEHTMSTDKPDMLASLDFLFQGCPQANQGQQAPACESVRVHLGLTEIVPQ